jgi:hypothetical protein
MKRPLRIIIVLIAVAALLSACANAADAADCSNLPANGPKIKVEGAWSRAGSGTIGAFMIIHNCSGQNDALLKASTPIAMLTQVHTTEMKDGVMSMSEVSKIDLPAGKKVELKSGGYHIMMMKLSQEVKAGDLVEITLVFEKAGEMKISAPAKSP